MKNLRIYIVCFLLILGMKAYSSEFIDEYAGMENAWGEQKAITNKEFEDAINVLTEKQKKKDEKLKKKKIKKISGGGTSLHKDIQPMGNILEQGIEKEISNDDGQLLNIPVNFVLEGKVLERGFYNIYGEKNKNNEIYLSFYQSHSLMGKVKAYSTNNDFNSSELNFVKMLPYDENYMQIVFGSLDFNAYTYVRFLEEKNTVNY